MKKHRTAKTLALICLLAVLQPAKAQQNKLDSLFMGADTTAVLDSLLADFDNFLDSMTRRRSMFFVGVGVGTGFFSFENKNSVYISTEKKLIVSPSVGYFHKSGLGVSATAFGLSNSGKFSFYQLALSPSYDWISRSISTGISYSHYFNKDSLDFYTTPIRDELYAYFSYKRWWVRPSISLSYGWGSKSEYEKQQIRLLRRRLQLRNRYFITIENEEEIRDFSLTISVRKDFDWYDLIAKNDNLTLTPVLLLNSGTQQFGFNTSYSYPFNPVRVNSLPANSTVSDQTSFSPQSAGAIVRASYMKGKFLLQPQVLFDYYLLETDSDPLNIVFAVSLSLAF